MFGTLKTLMAGAGARAEEALRDTYAIDLIEQKIRDSEAALKGAKQSLAALIQRERAEARQVETLQSRISDLMARAGAALEDGREDLAQEAAEAVATLENELAVRKETLARLETRSLRLRQSIEGAHRRLTDLRHGALAARTAAREQAIQKRLGRHVAQDSSFEEAEALIAHVLNREDPFEQSQILSEIDRGLDRANTADRLAEAGYGPATKSTAADVLARLKS